jgi:hypothetical protein
MRKIRRLGFILIFMIISLALLAQTRVYDLKDENKDHKISLSEIIGNWYSVDSPRYKISFTNLNNYIVEINGIKHGVGNYSFIVRDDSISVNGTAANWPPYDCTLRLINRKLLEIEFYYIFSKETTKIIYKR